MLVYNLSLTEHAPHVRMGDSLYRCSNYKLCDGLYPVNHHNPANTIRQLLNKGRRIISVMVQRSIHRNIKPVRRLCTSWIVTHLQCRHKCAESFNAIAGLHKRTDHDVCLVIVVLRS